MRGPNGVLSAVLRVRRPLLALIALVVLLGGGYLVKSAGSDSDSPPAIRTVALSSLPPQVKETIERIEENSPPHYRHDGEVFENREHRLPAKNRGYYHAYTVPTPGEDDRGARRLITGSARELYYTKDHYASFVRIRP
ncbi:MAG TPA: ribonuclease domain-containing protein [Mycobacteriales bacterium]|nr:ribonuclease domain-containing protein [Mycobacteriales bacterium]